MPTWFIRAMASCGLDVIMRVSRSQKSALRDLGVSITRERAIGAA